MSKNKAGRRAARSGSPQQRVKSLIDSFVSATAAELSTNLRRRMAFLRIVARVRSGSNLLKPARLYGWRACRHIQNVVQLCSNMAEYSSRWIRQPEDWSMFRPACQSSLCETLSEVSPDAEIRSLLNHLFARQPVPSFLFRYWFGQADRELRNGRVLFLHLAAGHSIRGTKWGASLDRKMAKRFSQAKHHASIGEAIRFARTGKLTPPKKHFPAGVSRRRRKALHVYRASSLDDCWKPVAIGDFYHTEPIDDRNCKNRTWIIRQLTSRRELAAEGIRLRHCVGYYWRYCLEHKSAIWTMESRDIFRTRGLLTIEVVPQQKDVVQIKGFCNRGPRKHEMKLIRLWAAQESLRLSI